MNNIIVSNKSWHKKFVDEIIEKSKSDIVYIDKIEELNFDNIYKYSPQKIFFPHWSYIIPKEIYENFQCIIFHMTDLPFGRGGSPLQNLISRGIYETKITALKCEEDIDAGPIYLQSPLSLHGNAEEIYLRTAELIKEMIIKIIKGKDIQPKKQNGEIVVFKRLKPEDGDIGRLDTLEKIFDFIRMLDADTYPKAFLKTENLCLEFERSTLKENYIKADVKITLRSDKSYEE